MNSEGETGRSQILKGFGCITLVLLTIGVVMYPVFTASTGTPRRPNCMANMCQITKAMLSYCGDYDDKFPCTRVPGVEHGMQPELGIDARNGVVPFRGATWVEIIDPYVSRGSIEDAKRGIMKGVFNCPEREKKWPKGVGQDIPDWHSYGYNFLFLGLPWNKDKSPKTNPYVGWGFVGGTPRIVDLEDTSQTILLVESRSIWAFPPYTNNGRPLGVNRTCISPRHNGKVNVTFCDGHVKPMDPRDLVTKGRTAKNRQLGCALDNRLWDPVKTEYQEVSE